MQAEKTKIELEAMVARSKTMQKRIKSLHDEVEVGILKRLTSRVVRYPTTLRSRFDLVTWVQSGIRSINTT